MMIVSLAVANAQNDRTIISTPEFNSQGRESVGLNHHDIDMKDTEVWCASMVQNAGEYDDNMCTHVGEAFNDACPHANRVDMQM